jgi:methyl-accepting chemotaxis protein
MEEIVGSVKKVSDLIAEIAAASEEQDAGIQQVNTAVTQMDQVVQQNAGLVEEATAATESMKGQAAVLLQTVSRFKLGDTQAAYVPVKPVAKPRAVAEMNPPTPIQVKASPKLPPVLTDSLAAPVPKAANGEWKEF